MTKLLTRHSISICYVFIKNKSFMELAILDYDDLDTGSLEGAVVRKHNDLIEARYRMPNLREQQVIFMLLGQIKPDDEDFKGYRISVSDFAKFIGVNSNSIYDEMEQTLFNLASRTIKIKNGKSFLVASWLSSAEYKHGSGYVELCFDPKLKPYLLQLQGHFTEYNLSSILHFKSIYTIRLYELLKKEARIVERYQKKKQFEKEFSYEFLREAFGIEKKEYKLFADFRRKAIEPAVTEIYDKTELNISDVIYGKTGRAVSKITFVVNIRDKADGDIRAVQIRIDEQPKEKDKSNKEALIERLQELGYGFESARRDVNKYGIQRIERSIAYTLAKKQSGEVKNLPAYLSQAIADDWGMAWETEAASTKAKAEQAKKEAKEREEREEKKRNEAKESHTKTLNIFYDLDEETQEELERDFVDFLKETENDFMVQKYKTVKAETEENERWADDPKVRVTFITFLKARGF